MDTPTTTPGPTMISGYEFHPAAELFPLIEGEDFQRLVDSIAERGLEQDIVLTDGVCAKAILDGRNRFRACLKAGVKPRFRQATLNESKDPYGFVVAMNLARRHLTGEDRKAVAEKLLKDNPEKSNRIVAQQAKVDHKTVAGVRGKLESTGEIPQLKATTGKDGKKRKARTKTFAPDPKHIDASKPPLEIVGKATVVLDFIDQKKAEYEPFLLLAGQLQSIFTKVLTLAELPIGKAINLEELKFIDIAKKAIRNAAPYMQCPYCNPLDEKKPKCKCTGRGWITKHYFEHHLTEKERQDLIDSEAVNRKAVSK